MIFDIIQTSHMVVDFVPNGLTNFINEIDSIMPILRHIKVKGVHNLSYK